MKVLVTGSSGHLGEALGRVLRHDGHDVVGLDVKEGQFTSESGSILDRSRVRRCLEGTQRVFHVATLHKPHIATHQRQQFLDTNVAGTLIVLEEAIRAGVEALVFTSTTSVFGSALVPKAGAPAAWITEDVQPIPKNIYGVTKKSAEDLCELFSRSHGLPCVVLRTSRFFPEEDDDKVLRDAYPDENLKMNEFLFRRADLEDVVSAHLIAASKAPSLGFRRYVISATTPFAPADVAALRVDAPAVVRRYVPDYEDEYRQRGWKMLPSIDRVYVSDRARAELGWQPRYDFRFLMERLRAGEEIRSQLAKEVGSKRYHRETFVDGPYPLEKTSHPNRPRA
jgi:nucleoside-diphosphate-sugar epimerase